MMDKIITVINRIQCDIAHGIGSFFSPTNWINWYRHGTAHTEIISNLERNANKKYFGFFSRLNWHQNYRIRRHYLRICQYRTNERTNEHTALNVTDLFFHFFFVCFNIFFSFGQANVFCWVCRIHDVDWQQSN